MIQPRHPAPEPIVEIPAAYLLFQVGEDGNYGSPVRHSQDIAIQVYNAHIPLGPNRELSLRQNAIRMIREWLEDVAEVGFFDAETASPAGKDGAH